jgi:hypothetical protein
MSLVAFNANARADELPTLARDTSLNDGLTVRQTPAVAFSGDIARTLQARHDSSPCADRGMDVVAYPINGMTLNKELRDKQMTGIGGGLRPDVFSESKRTAAWRCDGRISTMLWSAQGYAVISHGLRAADNAGPRPSNVPCRHGRPQTDPARVRAIAGISRRSHAYPLARQVAAGLPGWPALQGAGQQHGRSLHGVDWQTHCRAASRQSALPLRMQRHRSGVSRMGTTRLGASGLCRGGAVSERGLGASLAASAELGGYDTP